MQQLIKNIVVQSNDIYMRAAVLDLLSSAYPELIFNVTMVQSTYRITKYQAQKYDLVITNTEGGELIYRSVFNNAKVLCGSFSARELINCFNENMALKKTRIKNKDIEVMNVKKLQICLYIKDGKRVDYISRKTNLKVKTVSLYINDMIRFLNLKNRVELYKYIITYL